MTILEMASSIRNHVADSLSGNITNQAFSLEQLIDEIDLTRSKLIHQYLHTAKLDNTQLMQNIDRLQLCCKPIEQGCGLYTGEEVPTVEIPMIATTFNKDAVSYIGLGNKQQSFKVYYDVDDIINHKFRFKTGHRPFAWVDTAALSNNKIAVRIFNMDKFDPLKYLTVRAIFEHPASVYSLDPTALEREYPAPGHMQKDIIKLLSEEYIRYYRQLNINPLVLPNQQQDPQT